MRVIILTADPGKPNDQIQDARPEKAAGVGKKQRAEQQRPSNAIELRPITGVAVAAWRRAAEPSQARAHFAIDERRSLRTGLAHGRGNERTGKRPRQAGCRVKRAASEAEAKQRRIIAAALLRAISDAGGTNETAALWLGVSNRTVFGWVHAEQPVKLETLLACPQLGKRFRRFLCSEEHHHTGPFIAKKRRGSK